MSHFSNNDPFVYAVTLLLAEEGGYVNNPSDHGGETKFGISKRSYPDLDIKSLTVAEATEIYRRDWWKKYRYDRINDSDLAAKVFSAAVNMGAATAHKLLQEALKAVDKPVCVDGIIGPVTIQAINLAPPYALIVAMRVEMAHYYKNLVKADASQKVFLTGWLRRAYR